MTGRVSSVELAPIDARLRGCWSSAARPSAGAHERGGTISLGSLIRLAQPFGLVERLVRTSVARLAADGWLEAERHGRQSDYRLTEHGRARFAEATLRIYGRGPDPWDGRWTLVILPQGSRAIREKVRDGRLGFGGAGS